MAGNRKKLLVTRIDSDYHLLVRKIASPKVGVFSGVESLLKTALLLMVEDLANDREFQRSYRDTYGEKMVPPTGGTATR